MTADFLNSSETLLALLILVALVFVIVCTAFSDRPDAHMRFLMDLMGDLPKKDDPYPRRTGEHE
jgi:hypothetical protein